MRIAFKKSDLEVGFLEWIKWRKCRSGWKIRFKKCRHTTSRDMKQPAKKDGFLKHFFTNTPQNLHIIIHGHLAAFSSPSSSKPLLTIVTKTNAPLSQPVFSTSPLSEKMPSEVAQTFYGSIKPGQKQTSVCLLFFVVLPSPNDSTNKTTLIKSPVATNGCLFEV